MRDLMMDWRRSHKCGQLNHTHEGLPVTLMGWVQKRRDLGGLIFIDLRDRSGIVQLVLDPEKTPEAFKKGETIRSEYVLAVQGIVNLRPAEQINKAMKTGSIEVIASDLKILNEAQTLPFYIKADVQAEESLRLKYRYLDLRRPDIQHALIMRHHITKAVRDYLDQAQFLEIETPILTKSTPEGARDYLVPSRVIPGNFYALPQSPQIFKQLLMIGGYDRYFQIARCFRDEDLRADRQPEFTQIDIEMSFISAEDIQNLAEGMMKYLYKNILAVDLGQQPFPRMTYDNAMALYGSDKPDIRFEMTFKDLAPVLTNSSFKVFSSTLATGGQIKCITAPGAGKYSRKKIDNLTTFVKKYGAKGLAWLAVEDNGLRSPIAKFLSEDEKTGIVSKAQAKPGDLILIIADQKSVVAQALGALRLHLGEELELIDHTQWAFLWVVDFPLFEYDEEEARFVAAHHPFTMPLDSDVPLLEKDPGQAHAKAYDLVLNGVEIGGGSLRIYDQDIQRKMFAAIGLTPEQAADKFGFFIEALQYGTPPHGGIAFGLDRLVMEMLHLSSIRDVIAFPKTTRASCLMTSAPGQVSEQQLNLLKIKPML